MNFALYAVMVNALEQMTNLLRPKKVKCVKIFSFRECMNSSISIQKSI